LTEVVKVRRGSLSQDHEADLDRTVLGPAGQRMKVWARSRTNKTNARDITAMAGHSKLIENLGRVLERRISESGVIARYPGCIRNRGLRRRVRLKQ
jgi:hypothetical protein